MEPTPSTPAPGRPIRPRLARLAEASILISAIAAVALVLTAGIAFVWGAAQAWSLVRLLVTEGAGAKVAVVDLLEVVDTYLLGTVALILGVGIVELFITPLRLPAWLVIDDLGDLKGKVIDGVILVAAVKFLEKLVISQDALDVLYYGLAVAVVSAVLLAVRWVGSTTAH
jgi:hypothetical protein